MKVQTVIWVIGMVVVMSSQVNAYTSCNDMGECTTVINGGLAIKR